MFGVGIILFCLEIGIFLVFVPWSTLWEHNLLFEYVPGVRPLLLGTVVRTAVSGLGGLDCLIGLSELRRLFASRPQK